MTQSVPPVQSRTRTEDSHFHRASAHTQSELSDWGKTCIWHWLAMVIVVIMGIGNDWQGSENVVGRHGFEVFHQHLVYRDCPNARATAVECITIICQQFDTGRFQYVLVVMSSIDV